MNSQNIHPNIALEIPLKIRPIIDPIATTAAASVATKIKAIEAATALTGC
jgi:hypothetical protein